MAANNLSIVLSYYDAINQSKPSLAAEKLEDNVQIISPLATKKGKVSVVGALKGLCSIVKSVIITDTFTSGNQVMLACDMLFPEPIGKLRAASLLTLDKGLIIRIEMTHKVSKV